MLKAIVFLLTGLITIQVTNIPVHADRGLSTRERFSHEYDINFRALIIGINQYTDPQIPDLMTAANDAADLATILSEQYGFKTELLLNRQATRKKIYFALRELVDSSAPNDSILIYYAGHGDLDRTFNDGWWIPSDATGGDPATYLDNSQVQKAMRSMRARHVLLISDACFSGTLFGGKSRGLPKVTGNDYYLTLFQEKSRWGMTSGNKTPVADQGQEDHSIFAYQLLKELRDNRAIYLSVQEIYTRIAPLIGNNSEQTPICRPIRNTGDQGGEFVFMLKNNDSEEKRKNEESSASTPLVSASKASNLKAGLETKARQESQTRPNAVELSNQVTNSCGMTFVYIPPGTFAMGSAESEIGRNGDEIVHQVHLSEGFFLSRTEVTVGQWRKFVQATAYRTEAEKTNAEHYWSDPGFAQSENHPATCVSFKDIEQFIMWLNQTDGHAYRLPTEAQWEYACRAGSSRSRLWGDLFNKACSFSNVADLSLKRVLPKAEIHACNDGFVYTAPVASFQPNGYGLYDMLGNVAEWCRDKYGRYLPLNTSFQGIPKSSDQLQTDPVGSSWGFRRVIRGGSWNCAPDQCRAADRVKLSSSSWNNDLGFRLVGQFQSGQNISLKIGN